jgi:hypothetical protein
VAGQLHRCAAWHASTFEVAYGGPAQIMRDATGAAGLLTRGLERLERHDSARLLLASTFVGGHAEEHPRHDVALLRQALVLLVLRLQEHA